MDWLLHGFRQADLRVCRAKEHLAELEHVLESFRDLDGEYLADDRGAGYGDVEELGELGSDMLQVILGEFVYNLRTALNYVTVALAEHDSPNQPVGGKVQFPTAEMPDLFARQRTSYLKGVSDEHRAIIESLQPYRGCDWTKLLQRLSNRDKHVALVRLNHQIVSFTTEHEADEPPAEDTEEVYRYRYRECEITFRDGTPIIETLQNLQTQVANFLEQLNAQLIVEFNAKVGPPRYRKNL